MTTKKQREAAQRNIRKAQAARKTMSKAELSRGQPEGRKRQKPGTGGGGENYHITVRPSEKFKTFRTQDVGGPGHIQRVAGKRSTGGWDTQKWLISKQDAHVEEGELIADTAEAKKVLRQLGSKPVHKKGDVFEAEPRPDIPERAKPTAAQRRARTRNIKKAQAARRRRGA